MKRTIKANESFEDLFFKWIDSGDLELNVTTIASYGATNTFVLIRFPLNDDVDKILVTENDVYGLDKVTFSNVGFYIKSLSRMFISVPWGTNVMTATTFDHFQLSDRCMKLDDAWQLFEDKWASFWADYIVSLNDSIMKARHSFIPSEARTVFTVGAEIIVNQYKELRAGNYVREYLCEDYDLSLSDFIKTFVKRATTDIGVEKEEKLNLFIGYIKDGSQFFAQIQHEIHDAHYYFDKPRSQEIIERYCRYLLSNYLAYLAVQDDKDSYNPSKGLMRTKEIRKAVKDFANETVVGSFKVGFRYRPMDNPKGIEAAASVKTLRLCPEDGELELYGLKILSPKEYKGVVTSKEHPIRAIYLLQGQSDFQKAR